MSDFDFDVVPRPPGRMPPPPPNGPETGGDGPPRRQARPAVPAPGRGRPRLPRPAMAVRDGGAVHTQERPPLTAA